MYGQENFQPIGSIVEGLSLKWTFEGFSTTVRLVKTTRHIRETGVSLGNHVCPIEDTPLEPLAPSQQYRIEGFKGDVPIMPRDFHFFIEFIFSLRFSRDFPVFHFCLHRMTDIMTRIPGNRCVLCMESSLITFQLRGIWSQRQFSSLRYEPNRILFLV